VDEEEFELENDKDQEEDEFSEISEEQSGS